MRTNSRQVAVAPPQDDCKGSSLLYDESAHQARGDEVLGWSSPGVVWATLRPLLTLVHMVGGEWHTRRGGDACVALVLLPRAPAPSHAMRNELLTYSEQG